MEDYIAHFIQRHAYCNVNQYYQQRTTTENKNKTTTEQGKDFAYNGISFIIRFNVPHLVVSTNGNDDDIHGGM